MAEEIKRRIKTMQDEVGTPLSFIALKTGLNVATISRFYNNKQVLRGDTLSKIDKFLSVRGF